MWLVSWCPWLTVRCYNSQGFGHYVVDYRLNSRRNEKTNFVVAKVNEESTLLLTCNENEKRNQEFL